MNKPLQSLYMVERYVRCGEMPLFLIFCRDKRGGEHYCIMLCSLKKLRELTRMRRGFPDPAPYGRVLCSGHGPTPGDTVREMLKARYNFDIEHCTTTDVRFFR